MQFVVKIAVVILLIGFPKVGWSASQTCLITTAMIEQRERIPRGLLYAIALTESGRWNAEERKGYAWPWTVRAAADAFVSETKAESMAIVQRLKNEGRSNIDVGCMQVNLHYHPDAFPNLQSAFDPIANITYAAKFLGKLRLEARSWQQAIQWYHSRDNARGEAYRLKVYGHWRTAQAEINKAHRALARTGYQAALADPTSIDNTIIISTEEPVSRPTRVATKPIPSKSASLVIGRDKPAILRGNNAKPLDMSPKPLANTGNSALFNVPATNNPVALHGVDVIRPNAASSTANASAQ